MCTATNVPNVIAVWAIHFQIEPPGGWHHNCRVNVCGQVLTLIRMKIKLSNHKGFVLKVYDNNNKTNNNTDKILNGSVQFVSLIFTVLAIGVMLNMSTMLVWDKKHVWCWFSTDFIFVIFSQSFPQQVILHRPIANNRSLTESFTYPFKTQINDNKQLFPTYRI